MQVARLRQPQNDSSFLNDCKPNENQISKDIENQFLYAISNINKDFQQIGYFIEYSPLKASAFAKDVEHLPMFELCIRRSFKLDSNDKSCFLSLGAISPFVDNTEKLVKEEIYSYWYNYLKEMIELAKNKHPHILRGKMELARLFCKAVEEVDQYIAYNHFKPTVINQEKIFPKHQPLGDIEDSFEPLKDFSIWKIEKVFVNHQLKNIPVLIGKIKMVSNAEFKKIIENPEKNLKQILDSFVKEVKSVVLKSNNTQIQVARIFAKTLYRDCWRISFIIFNRFKNLLTNFIIRRKI